MPFVQRVVQPIYISRTKKTSESSYQQSTSSGAAAAGSHDTVTGRNIVESTTTTTTVLAVPHADYEFDYVTNLTLSNALRQLASLVLIANDIFTELNAELHNVGERARGIKCRIDTLEKTVDEFDPKLVAVRKYNILYFPNLYLFLSKASNRGLYFVHTKFKLRFGYL